MWEPLSWVKEYLQVSGGNHFVATFCKTGKRLKGTEVEELGGSRGLFHHLHFPSGTEAGYDSHVSRKLVLWLALFFSFLINLHHPSLLI